MGNDLRLEAALGDGGGGTAMGFDGQRILLFAGDAPLDRQVFGGDAHVADAEGVVEGWRPWSRSSGVAHGAPERMAVER